MKCPRCNGRGKIQRCIGHEGRGMIFKCNICNGEGDVAQMPHPEIVKHEAAFRDDGRLVEPSSIAERRR
jgi:hypothetical protein